MRNIVCNIVCNIMPAEQLASAVDTIVEVGSPALQRSVFASCHDWGSIWIMCVRTFASWGAALIWITQDSSHVQLFVCDCVHIFSIPRLHKCATIRDRLPFASTPCSLRCGLVGKSSVQVQRDVKCVALSVRHYAGKRTSADTCTSGEPAVDQLCAGTHIMQHRHSHINLARQQTHKDKNTLTHTLTQSYTEI